MALGEATDASIIVAIVIPSNTPEGRFHRIRSSADGRLAHRSENKNLLPTKGYRWY